MNESLSEIRAFIISNASQQPHAQAYSGYSGSNHLHYGLSVPLIRNFAKSWISQHKALTYEEWLELLDGLYYGDSLEEIVMAGIFLNQFSKYRHQLPLSVFETWLDQLEGWAEVDGTCQSTFSPNELFARWDEWVIFLRKLAQDPNINKQRASLVLLIRAVRESSNERPLTLAFEQINALMGLTDKRIVKAISWVLREAAKRHPDQVAAYVEENQAILPKSVMREVRTKLTTGKKTSRALSTSI